MVPVDLFLSFPCDLSLVYTNKISLLSRIQYLCRLNMFPREQKSLIRRKMKEILYLLLLSLLGLLCLLGLFGKSFFERFICSMDIIQNTKKSKVSSIIQLLYIYKCQPHNKLKIFGKERKKTCCIFHDENHERQHRFQSTQRSCIHNDGTIIIYI